MALSDEELEELRQAQKLVEMLDPLTKQEGWEFYLEMLQKQINIRQLEAPKASADFGGVFAKEFKSGEINGLMLAKALPLGALAAAKEIILEYKEAENASNEE